MNKYDAPSGTERILWARHEYSTREVPIENTRSIFSKNKFEYQYYESGLREINEYLENGWEVKMISSCAGGTEISIYDGVYVVLRKK